MTLSRNIIGYAALILGIVCIAFLIHIESTWIFGIATLLVGLGVVGGFECSNQNDDDH